VSRRAGAVSRGVLAAAVAALATAGGALALSAADEDDGGGGAPPARSSATGEWRALTPAGLERTEVGAARIGRFVYVVGGFERRTGLTTRALERYDIHRDRWKRLRPMPVGLNHPVAVGHRGRLYVHGGYRGRRDLSSATARLFVYSPRHNRWGRRPPSGEPRAAHAAAALGGRLYVAGGRNESGELRSLEVYDFRRRRWRPGPDLRGPARDHMTGVAAGGFFYALAGRDLSGPGNFRTAERYSPRTRRWELLPPMRKARGGIASARVSGNRIVVFGGEESQGTIAEVELFDPRARSWRPLPSMRTPRHGLGGVSFGNRVLAIEGGPQPGFHFSNALEFLDVP
jgi:N-acetylneuraminic acid mutarotase